MQALVRERARFDRVIGGNGARRELTPAKQMWTLLERYRRRSDRYGQGFSVAVFRSDGSRRAVLRMVRLIAGRARLSDEVGWLEGCSVCVILPDTQAAGANCFASAVVELVGPRCGRPQFTLYSYPTDPSSGDDHGDHHKGNGRNNKGNGRISQESDKTSKNGHRSAALGRSLSRGQAEGALQAAGVAHLEKCAIVCQSVPLGQADGEAAAGARPLEPLFVRPLPWWKRSLDMVGAAVLAILTLPIMIFAAVAVRFSSGGPIIFRQQRAGLGGTPFTIYKFRTMNEGADAGKHHLRPLSEQDGPAFKLSNDPRVTRIGAILRKTSIDELPQLWNVLKGEMSLVGPRPLPLDESAQCSAWQRRRLEVTPGITCVWQVRGRSRVTFEQWVRMDVGYLSRRTLAGDLKLLLQTVPAVLLRRGAR